jgi:DNA mismatch repair protein MutS
MTTLILSSREIDCSLLTPMMQHYVEVKNQNPQAILLYRMGDFYEAFLDDACIISRELELVLTGKEAGKQVGRVAMSGVPHHALDRYARQLVEKGFSVAICEQMETAAAAQGNLVRREVTHTITPGTVIEEGMLAAKRHNFLVAIVGNFDQPNPDQPFGLAYADVSTGDFLATQLNSREQLIQELLRLQPAEILLPSDLPNPWESNQLPGDFPAQFCYTKRSFTGFDLIEARQRILTTFRLRSLEGIGCDGIPLAVRAAGGILTYLSATQKLSEFPLKTLTSYRLSDYLWLDHQTRRNLEIVQTVRDGTLQGSLLWALDQTCTSMGGRALRRWLLQPLQDLNAICDRADTISELTQKHQLRQALRLCLGQIYDIERLCSRIGNNSANARDLVSLSLSLSRLEDLAAIATSANSPYLQVLQAVPSELLELAKLLAASLCENPPLFLTEGNLINAGINPELDQMRQQAKADVDWLADLEKTERDRTGINTLKVGFNKAFGYYISITRGKIEQAPSDYIRRQTLTNEERYITPELKERETRILNAEREQFELEYQLFNELRQKAANQISSIRIVASHLAAADSLASLAEVAVKYHYCRPTLTSDRTISIRNGRHPVVEQTIPSGFFVPNNTELGNTQTPDLIVLTGPNMSGKSIYLRQIGLMQLMAQVGSFVPAESACFGICDRIFTRVGAVDDLATGQSTFMVEMNETANILNHAKSNSLVLLDEIGRGTSTFDGMAIAWSVAEYLAKQIQARSIFATHYHELNELATMLPRVANFQVTVKEMEDEIIFLHQVQPGGADRSYGIEVGRLAGLPKPVIQRAKELLGLISRSSHIATGLRSNGKKVAKPESQLQIFELIE